MLTEKEFATQVVARLREHGYEAYWAGGCVRDELLGLEPADYDIATDARPEQVRRLFRYTVEVGIAFGVIEVLGPRQENGDILCVQVATFRHDGAYSDGRRPDAVTFCSSQEDALRRDFTINGMFFDPLDGRLIDYVGGQADLAAKRLRAIGNPAERFTEDKLRMLRAVRMATRFELTIDPATADAIRLLAPEINAVSAERIADECRKLFVHPYRARGVQLLRELGLQSVIFTEMDILTPSQQSTIDDALQRLGGAMWPTPLPVSFPAAFALWLSMLEPQAIQNITARLKLANEERHRIAWLKLHQQTLMQVPLLRWSRWQPLMVHPGIGELLSLHAACGDHEIVQWCERIFQESSSERLDPPPLITGHDLHMLGMKPGPLFKQLLDTVRDMQLDGVLIDRDQALTWVQSQSV